MPLRSRLASSWQRFRVRLPGPLRANPLFHADWYRDRYPDVAGAGMSPYAHYRRFGVAEGRDANRLFDTGWYLERYPDVRANGVDPIDHYLLFGAREGRDPGPDFRTNWYVRQNPDVAASGINPLVHYFEHGEVEGRAPLPPKRAVPDERAQRAAGSEPRTIRSGDRLARPERAGGRDHAGRRDSAGRLPGGVREVLLDVGMLALVLAFAPLAAVGGLIRRVRRRARRLTRGAT